MPVYNFIYPCFLILGMEDRWEDSFENGMKTYLDELHIECGKELDQSEVHRTESEWNDKLAEMVAEKFMASVERSLRASKRSITSNGTRKAIEYERWELIKLSTD